MVVLCGLVARRELRRVLKGVSFAIPNHREKEISPRPAPEGSLCEKCPLIRPYKVVDPSGAGCGVLGSIRGGRVECAAENRN